MKVDYEAIKESLGVDDSEPSSSYKEFVLEVSVDVVEPPRQITQLFTRSRRGSTQIVDPVVTTPQVKPVISDA